jgi:hypothetical protein
MNANQEQGIKLESRLAEEIPRAAMPTWRW